MQLAKSIYVNTATGQVVLDMDSPGIWAVDSINLDTEVVPLVPTVA